MTARGYVATRLRRRARGQKEADAPATQNTRGQPRWLAALCGCAVLVAALVASTVGTSFSGAAAADTQTATAGAAAPVVTGADWPTFDFDAARTGVGPGGTGITAGDVPSLRLQVVHVDGTVDASAVELHAITVNSVRHDVLFVTTTYGRTIAIAAGTGRKLWEYTPADIGSYQGTAQVTTATPVVDPGRSFIYAASPDGLVHKLSVATGQEVRSAPWPARVTYDPTREKIASALNVNGSSVIVVTGGYVGDIPVYQGHLVTIDRASGRVTHVFNTLCSNRTGLIDPPLSCAFSDSAIWARAGAVVEPGSGRLLIATGNGDFNGATNWADSVLELSPAAQLLHNWTPTDQAALNSGDADLGSTAPALVTAGDRRLAVQGGKDRKLHLLDLDRLDGTTGPAGPRLGGALQSVSSPGAGQVKTAPAVWSAGGLNYLFVADTGGTAAYAVRGGAHPALTRAWGNSTPGTSPVLAGGVLYVYDEVDGVLDLYAPRSGARLASLPVAGGHWNSPIVVGGRIVEPVGGYEDHATTGELYIWHLPGH